MEFAGFVALEGTLTAWVAVVDANYQPVAPDAAPTFRVYGASGLLASASGTCTLGHTGSVTGATNASPIVVASAAHGLATGMRVTVASVAGNTAANGTFVITRVDADHFSLGGSTGNSAYTSGGTWNVVGWYKASVSAAGGSGFEAGEHFALSLTWAVSSAARTKTLGFGVT